MKNKNLSSSSTRNKSYFDNDLIYKLLKEIFSFLLHAHWVLELKYKIDVKYSKL